MKPKRFVEFDCIRAIAALIIVSFHFSSEILAHTESAWAPFYFFFDFPNGNWGGAAVTLFFLLSGALLYYQHNDLNTPLEVVQFYLHRGFTVLLPFWIVWLYLYLQNVLAQGDWFYAGPPSRLLLSVVGLDGYFLYRAPNYYLIGEWFLGAILLGYLLYPLLLIALKKAPKVATLLLFVGFGIAYKSHVFTISPRRNLFTCLLLLWIGMLLMKYRDHFLTRRLAGPVSLAVAVVLLLVPFPRASIALEFAFSLAVFLFLWTSSGRIMQTPFLGRWLAFTSKISFPIFLIHHVLIYNQCGKCLGRSLSTGDEILLFLFCLAQIYFFAYILYQVSRTFRHLLKTTVCSTITGGNT